MKYPFSGQVSTSNSKSTVISLNWKTNMYTARNFTDKSLFIRSICFKAHTSGPVNFIERFPKRLEFATLQKKMTMTICLNHIRSLFIALSWFKALSFYSVNSLFKTLYTVDVYRYKTIESIWNSFVAFTKGISYRFYWYYL